MAKVDHIEQEHMALRPSLISCGQRLNLCSDLNESRRASHKQYTYIHTHTVFAHTHAYNTICAKTHHVHAYNAICAKTHHVDLCHDDEK